MNRILILSTIAFTLASTHDSGVCAEDSKPAAKSAAAESSHQTLTPAELKFKDLLTGATLTGRWAPIKDGKMGEEKQDEYAIAGATKIKDDSWIIAAKMKYAGHEIVAPIPVQVKWAGDTPVIVVDKMTIPGGGTYSARVLFFEKTYAGSWTGKNHAGLLSGTISKNK
jgi:hypothetical protein